MTKTTDPAEQTTGELMMEDELDTETHDVDEVSPEVVEQAQMKLDLFAAATDDHSTNALEIYDGAARFVHHKKIFDVSDSAFIAIPFTVKKVKYESEITAARIKIKEKDPSTGKKREVERIAFPGEVEQVVEDVLRKMATMQYGYVFRGRIGCRFTLYALREECKKAGHEYNYTQLQHALTVLRGASCKITNTYTGEIWEENYFSNLVRGGYRFMEDGKRENEPWLITFHSLVNESVLELTYRSMKYPRLMNIRNQMAKWLYKRLVNTWTYADLSSPYQPTLVRTLIESGKGLSYRKDTGRAHNANNLRAFKDMVDSLIKVGVLDRAEEQVDYRRKLDDGTVDRRFDLYPTAAFVSEQIDSNKKFKERQSQAAMEKLTNMKKSL